MRLTSLLLFVFAVALVPNIAQADADARQDSCVSFVENETLFTVVHFSVINFSLPGDIHSFRMIPEPLPVLPECEMIACSHPVGWDCKLEADGGATWFVLDESTAISPGEILSGFDYLLDPGFCCYVTQFFDEAGNLLGEQESCFCDKPVQNIESTWGQLKSSYR